nr:MAG TPA: hypothetical protein [Caudoviricetes sp.]
MRCFKMKFVSYVLSVFLYTIPILLFLAAVAGVLYASEHLPGWFILPLFALDAFIVWKEMK